MSVIHVNNDEEFKKVIEGAGDKRVIVKAGTSWCQPCKRIAPFFEKLAEEYSDTVYVAIDTIDEDEFEDTIIDINIRAFPTFVLIFEGEEVKRVVGTDKDELRLLAKMGAK